MSADLLSLALAAAAGGAVGAAIAWPRGFLKGDAFGRAAILEKLSSTLKRPVQDGSFAPGGADELDQVRRMVSKGAKFASSSASQE